MAEEKITPYGDYCRDCTTYGKCREMIHSKEAIRALYRYYAHKGYRVGAVYQKGRFIEAEIYRDNVQVDKVIFDRKTGRLRSTY